MLLLYKVFYLKGISTGEPLSEAPPDLWRRLMNVNVVAASLCAQISVNSMIENGKSFFPIKIKKGHGWSILP